MITAKDATYAQKCRELRNHGVTKSESQFKRAVRSRVAYYEIQKLGMNYRLTDLQCAIGVEQLKKLKTFIRKRAKIAKRYHQALKDIPGVSYLVQKNGKSAWHLFVIRCRKSLGLSRDRLADALIQAEIIPSLHYLPIPEHPLYKKKYQSKIFPGAQAFYESILSIPIYPDLSLRDQGRVIKVVRGWASKQVVRERNGMLYKRDSLILRKMQRSDLNRTYLKWLNDRAVNRYMAKQTYRFEDIVNYYDRLISQPKKNIFFAVCDGKSKKAIGTATLTNLKKGNACFGMMIGDRRFRGRGLGELATRSVCSYGFRQLGIRKIKLDVLVSNKAAVKAFQKTGFVIKKKYLNQSENYKNKPTLSMELSASSNKRKS